MLSPSRDPPPYFDLNLVEIQWLAACDICCISSALPLQAGRLSMVWCPCVRVPYKLPSLPCSKRLRLHSQQLGRSLPVAPTCSRSIQCSQCALASVFRVLLSKAWDTRHLACGRLVRHEAAFAHPAPPYACHVPCETAPVTSLGAYLIRLLVHPFIDALHVLEHSWQACAT